jgi:hypothetical protein
MQIVPNGVSPAWYQDSQGNRYYSADDTIAITDEEWDEIYHGYNKWFYSFELNEHRPHRFGQYLRELITLRQS